jgi:hypothetical protein
MYYIFSLVMQASGSGRLDRRSAHPYTADQLLQAAGTKHPGLRLEAAFYTTNYSTGERIPAKKFLEILKAGGMLAEVFFEFD